jgi:hypothetical protein
MNVEVMNFSEAAAKEREAREQQQSSKYKDTDIKEHIAKADNGAAYSDHYRGKDYQEPIAHALIAQAMIQYNQMIDGRWING